jgi:hypothetical protein
MRGTHLIVGVGHGPQRFVVVRHGLCGRCRGSPIVAGITTSIVIDCVSDFLACSTVIGEVACGLAFDAKEFADRGTWSRFSLFNIALRGATNASGTMNTSNVCGRCMTTRVGTRRAARRERDRLIGIVRPDDLGCVLQCAVGSDGIPVRCKRRHCAAK